MSRKKISPDNQTRTVKNVRRPSKQGISLSWSYRLLTLCCGIILIGGIFFAARQHFSSIDVSMKNSRLRKQGEELLADKRRLLLSKEIALSPSEIKKAAQKIGFTMAAPVNNLAAVRTISEKPEMPQAEKSNAGQLKQSTSGKTQDQKTGAKTVSKTGK